MSDDPYTIVFTAPARRAIAEKLPEEVATAVLNFIAGPLRLEPHRVGKPLHPPLADRHSARRGTYRVLYKINDTNRTVTILDIRHRSTAYRS